MPSPRPRPHQRRSGRGIGALLLGLVLACGPAAEDGQERTGAAPVDPVPLSGLGDPDRATSLDERQRELAAIGYVEIARPPGAAAEGTGVVLFDPGRSVPGVNLVTSISTGLVTLLEGDGTELHRWQAERATWTRARLLEDGDLVVIGIERFEEGMHPLLQRLAWDGSPRWRLKIAAHHDVEVLPDGRLMVLTKSERPRPGYAPSGMIRDNELTLVSADGEVLARRSVCDLIDAAPEPFTWVPWDALPGRRDPTVPADLLHLNSLVWLDDPRLAERQPLLAPGRVLASSRHQSRLLLFDWEQGRLVWSSEPGRLQLQHEAQALPDGRLLLFDNGTEERGWSRIVELDPVSGEITWEYRADPPERFFSPGRGTVQALRGGHVLVANSAAGEAFEVTREGELVWRLLNPDTGKDGVHRALRIERLPLDRVRGLLARHGAAGPR